MNNSREIKTVYINSAGCNENLLDGEILKSIVRNANLSLIDDPKIADLIVYNTCAFKKRQEDITIRTIKKLQRIKKSGAELIVCGCVVAINRERLQKVFEGASFVPFELRRFLTIIGTKGIEQVEEVNHIGRASFSTQIFGRSLIDKIYLVKSALKKISGIDFLPNFDILDFLGDENTFFLRISRGCLNKCGYCAVRFAQGPLVSMLPQRVLENVKNAIRQGHKRIFLSATNISIYGQDIGADFLDTLEQIVSQEGDYKIVIHNLEPFGITEDAEKFLKIFSSPRISAFYCPINSGSQDVLERMNRKYDVVKLMETLSVLRKSNPGVLIRTEFIIGYPGETWKDFFKTVLLIAKFKFSLIDLHRYSPRPNTEALYLEGKVPAPIKYLRYLMLLPIIFFRVWLPRLRPV